MFWLKLFLFLHIMSAIILLGGLFARQIVRAYAKKSSDVRIISELYKAAARIEMLMVRPFKAPIFGYLQGADQNWLLVTNIMVLLIPFPIIFFFVPRGKILEPIMQDALAKGQVTPQLREQLHDPAMRRVHFMEITGAVIVVILMVFKPF